MIELEIQAPGPLAAESLTQRLRPSNPSSAHGSDDGCTVRAAFKAPELRHVLTEVAEWLDAYAIETAALRIDGKPYTMSARLPLDRFARSSDEIPEDILA